MFLKALHGIEIDKRGRAVDSDTILKRARDLSAIRGKALSTYIDDHRRLLRMDKSPEGRYVVTEVYRDQAGEGRISRSFFSERSAAESYCSMTAKAYREKYAAADHKRGLWR